MTTEQRFRALLMRALAYERRAFEDETAVDGADLVDWFAEWRGDVIDALETTARVFPGFASVETGGGCTALQCDLPDGRYAMLTDCDDPVEPVQGRAFVLGFYDSDGTPIILEGTDDCGTFTFAAETSQTELAVFIEQMLINLKRQA